VTNVKDALIEIGVKVPSSMLEEIEATVATGDYATKSHFVRCSIRDKLARYRRWKASSETKKGDRGDAIEG
jgi:Arc/MetJ-type ribon-helix-helix transcriptional regulator